MSAVSTGWSVLSANAEVAWPTTAGGAAECRAHVDPPPSTTAAGAGENIGDAHELVHHHQASHHGCYGTSAETAAALRRLPTVDRVVVSADRSITPVGLLRCRSRRLRAVPCTIWPSWQPRSG